MTPDAIQEIRNSFKSVAAISDAAAEDFYNRLFVLDPGARALFADDMTEQYRNLMQALSVAVDSLDQPETLLPFLRDLGTRHAGYGVQPEHYDMAGTALLETLDAGLGAAFTPECQAAWAELWGIVAAIMQEGA